MLNPPLIEKLLLGAIISYTTFYGTSLYYNFISIISISLYPEIGLPQKVVLLVYNFL